MANSHFGNVLSYLQDFGPEANRPPKTQAKYVEFGYGQVEPNHLSAQRNGQIYAQLPANPEIKILEQGQFVKYDYAANGNGIGEVNFKGEGEWMLVYNEIKLYRDHWDGTKQWDCEFAMIKDAYNARVYTPYDWEAPELEYKTRYLNGVDSEGKDHFTLTHTVELDRIPLTKDADDKPMLSVTIEGERIPVNADDLSFTYNEKNYTLVQETRMVGGKEINWGMPKCEVEIDHYYEDFTEDVRDIYEMNWTNDPYRELGIYREKKMPKGTTMVPRVYKTMPGDIFTTNTINEETLVIGDILAPDETGILSKSGDLAAMKWQVVKLYDMPDGQKAAKVMRIA